MRKNSRIRKNLGFIVTVFFALIVLGGAYYSRWNRIDPRKSCAKCHEIESSVHMQKESSHRDLQCSECHGTAFSNGMKGFSEKGKMILSHFTKKNVEDIKMSEEQYLDILLNCKRCHESEYAQWKSSGHSVNYKSIFLNEEHNAAVPVNFDCLRCHGMFYDGTVDELVMLSEEDGNLVMPDTAQASRPAILCLTCHQVHKPGQVAQVPDYSDPDSIFYHSDRRRLVPDFYDIHEKTYYTASELPQLAMVHSDSLIQVSADVAMRNCVQCHAPNAHREVGSADDHTPMGVHEGISCLACHNPHSNDPSSSCINCHPAISNCKLDVNTMNTTFSDPKSPNDIHTVSCADCHDKK